MSDGRIVIKLNFAGKGFGLTTLGIEGGMTPNKKPEGPIKFDEVGHWSEIKLEIIKQYAQAYSIILAKQPLKHIYIDAFAGAGKHISRETKQLIPGSPLNALNIDPPFCEYHFIDIKAEKVKILHDIAKERPRQVFIYEGDCNEVLTAKVFPRVRYEDYRRGLCLLDPYGLHLDWKVIATAGEMGTIDVILNFPVMDMNRNVFWRNPEAVHESDIARMDCFWGGHFWKDIIYDTTGDLFGHPEKVDTKYIVEAFAERLHQEAGFKFVSKPIPLTNSQGGIIYYLFFASQKQVAVKIASSIFNKYR